MGTPVHQRRFSRTLAIVTMPQFLLSEKTSYPFKKISSNDVTNDWTDQSLNPSQHRSYISSNDVKKSRLSKWHQLNSLVVERQETQLISIAPENEPIKHQKANISHSLVNCKTLPTNSKPPLSLVNQRAVHRSGHASLGNILKDASFEDEDISDTLKVRVTDALRRRDRPRIDQSFFSVPYDAHSGGFDDGLQNDDIINKENDDTDDDENFVTRVQPSVRRIKKLKRQNFPSSVKQNAEGAVSRHRGFSLERGLDAERRVRQNDREWRMSASPVMIHGHLRSLRSERLDMVALCHHIPRVNLPRVNKDDSSSSSTSRDSGQDTLTDDQSSQSELLLSDNDQSESRSEQTDQSQSRYQLFDLSNPRSKLSNQLEYRNNYSYQSLSKFDLPEQSQSKSSRGRKNAEKIGSSSSEEARIMHRYIASRGQRERETDIYEVNPPPHLSLLSCEI